MAHDVFISYSSKDKAVADQLCATLEGQGIECWIAPRDISYGSDYGEAIVDGINQSRAMVLVFSSHANTSPHIKREVDRAVSKGVTIIPVRIEDVAPTRALEYYISPVHWLDAITPPVENHFKALAAKIRPLVATPAADRPAPAPPAAALAPAPPAPIVVPSPPTPIVVPSAPAPIGAPVTVPMTAASMVPPTVVPHGSSAAVRGPATGGGATTTTDASAAGVERSSAGPATPRRFGPGAAIGASVAAVVIAGVLWAQPWAPGDTAARQAKLEEERRSDGARQAQLAEDERRREAMKQSEATRQAADEAAKRAEDATRRLEEARRADDTRRAKLAEDKRVQDTTARVNLAPVARVDPAAAKMALEQKLRDHGLLKQGNADRWGVSVEMGGDGIVTLTGVLQTLEQRNETVRLAGQVPGVAGVQQRINVQQSWK